MSFLLYNTVEMPLKLILIVETRCYFSRTRDFKKSFTHISSLNSYDKSVILFSVEVQRR